MQTEKQDHVGEYWVRTIGDGVKSTAWTSVYRTDSAGRIIAPAPVAQWITMGRRERLEQHRKACRMAKEGAFVRAPSVAA